MTETKYGDLISRGEESGDDWSSRVPRSHRIPLKFAPKPREVVHLAASRGRLAATVRFDFEADISEGNQLALLTQDGDEWGTGTVEETIETKVQTALDPIKSSNALYRAQSPSYLVAALNKHYDETIWPHTDVEVFIFEPSVERSESEGLNEVAELGQGTE